MDVISYKCPCCGAPLEFNSESQQLKCDSCNNTFDIHAVKAFNETEQGETDSGTQWEAYGSESGHGDWRQGEDANMEIYECPSCAAEIVVDKSTGATECVYCGNQTIIPKQFSGMFRPDYVIPFKVNKEQAKAAFTAYCKGKRLLPKLFTEKNRIEKITGLYVPFWLFDCETHSKITYKAETIRSWSDGNFNHTKTDHYLLQREGKVGFNKIPVDGSSKLEDDLMESIEPFNYDELIDFETAYLSGYLADKYDVDAEQSIERANQRIKRSVEETFRSTALKYQNLTPTSTQIDLLDKKQSYALMPIWILNTKYEDKVYTFAMNGQTGKFIGDLPISKQRFWGWFGRIAGGITAAGFLIMVVAKAVIG